MRGAYFNGYEPFSRIWAKPKFRHRPRGPSMPKEKSWGTLSPNLCGFGTRRSKACVLRYTASGMPRSRKNAKALSARTSGVVESVRSSLDTAPSFRQAFRKRRCLVPVDGFYGMEESSGRQNPVLDQRDKVFQDARAAQPVKVFNSMLCR